MPYLTLPFTEERGPLLDVLVRVAESAAKAMAAAGSPLPPPIVARAMIDTGSVGTIVDSSILSRLGVQPSGVFRVLTSQTGGVPHEARRFDVSLTLYHPDRSLTFLELQVAEGKLNDLGVEVLIGRDLLQRCYFAYDGRAGTFMLAF